MTGPVTLHVSQAELARSAGLSRQALSGMLRRLQQRGLIEIGFRRIVVRDEDALRRAAQEDGMEALAARDA